MIVEDIQAAEKFLKSCFLSFEIIEFASNYMNKNNNDDYLKSLLQLVHKTRNKHNHNERNLYSCLGGNCVSLIYRLKGELPDVQWNNLILDNAYLYNANLYGKNFSNTSLKHANLDNANFEYADFRYSDLSGVRLEETYGACSISIPKNNAEDTIFTAYDNNTVIQWKLNLEHSKLDILQKINDKKEIKLIALSSNDLSVLYGNEFKYYEKLDNEFKEQATFKIKQNIRVVKVGIQSALIIIPKEYSNAELQLISLNDLKVINYTDVSLFSICENIGDKAFVVYDDTKGLRLINTNSIHQVDLICEGVKDVSCLTSFKNESENEFFLGIGLKNGKIQIWKIYIVNEIWNLECLAINNSHSSFVRDIEFLDQRHIVSVDLDGKMCLNEFDQINAINVKFEYKLEIKCKGMEIEGLKGDYEQRRLKELVNRTL